MPSSVRRRQGFTLVELLIVIVIIGMLMALVGVVATRALSKGVQTAIQMEIELLGGGLKSYKDANSSFPPSFAAYDTTAPYDHHGLIMRHLANAFPQYIQDADGDGDHDYEDFRADVATGTTDATFTGGRETNTLDQAEALVFWLGGLPSLTTESRMIGFSLNPANPFENDTLQPQRSKRHFEFATVRLVDEDNDGWLEYIPKGSPPVGVMCPYVYFDSASFTASTSATPIALASYPSTVTGALRGPAARISEWGVAWPMWRVAPDPSGTPPVAAQWVNSDSYQIICGGADGAYSVGSPFPTLPTEFVDGLEGVDSEDPILDNLTNFAEGTLEDERDAHE